MGTKDYLLFLLCSIPLSADWREFATITLPYFGSAPVHQPIAKTYLKKVDLSFRSLDEYTRQADNPYIPIPYDAEKVVRDIIPILKAHGAEGIIEYPLNKVV